MYYPSHNLKRPTGPTCDGGHSVNYNIHTKTPRSGTWAAKSATDLPVRTWHSRVRGSDTCTQCHSQSRPLTPVIEGQAYDWRVGFQVGLDLADYWQLEDHKLGETTFTHFRDGTSHKNRMQGNDFVTSVMYTRGLTCGSCHDVHGTENNADLLKPAQVLCLECHGPQSPNGPHAVAIDEHTHHKAGASGNECVGCHMPRIETEVADVNVRSHTFRFISPAETECLKMPNSFSSCHTDKTAAWATGALKSWKEFSPWRVAN